TASSSPHLDKLAHLVELIHCIWKKKNLSFKICKIM
ncbi:hypothetical protein AVEN_214800-1, partial [Araneus ventricosus]